jgi:hypothetical protein
MDRTSDGWTDGQSFSPIDGQTDRQLNRLRAKDLRSYSQHLILFIIYEWAQLARAFVPGKPFKLSVMKHSSLFSPIESYDENEFF